MNRTLLVLCGTIPSLAAHAQTQPTQPSWASPALQQQEQAPPPTVGMEGAIPPNPYEGVVPGESNPPPRMGQIANAGRPLVTWPGFQMTATGSRVFVQTSGAVGFDETRGANRVSILFRNCRIHTRNNRNPLVTRHFNTPVSTAYLVTRRNSVELVVELRSQVAPSITTGEGAGGFRFVFVDFPAGSFLPAGADSVPVPSWQPSASSEPEGAEEVPEPMMPEGAGPTE